VITTELVVDGTSRVTTVRRSWAPDAALNGATVRVTTGDGAADDLDTLGLGRSLNLYRPFLTAADLGRLIAGTPSEIFDALGTILGLDGLTDADRHLRDALRTDEQTIARVRTAAAALGTRLTSVCDNRARRAEIELAKPGPSLDVLAAIAAEPLPASADIGAATRLASLSLSDATAVAELADEIRLAARAARGRDSAVTRISLRVADILRAGIAHHLDLGDGPCPMCRTGRLDGDWRRSAAESLQAMDSANAAAHEGRQRLQDATAKAADLCAALDFVDDLDVPDDSAIDASALRAAVHRLRAMPSEPGALADHLDAAYPAAAQAAVAARAAARTWLDRVDGAWREVSAELHAWLASAREVPECERRIALVRRARAWLRTSGEQIRNERLAPFAEHSQRIWRELRQESNVELGAMTLSGSNTRRRVQFPVSVDGTDTGAALGVMSQGEMHALGLATFLPRSCADESPFRFIVIDDPVQSMDPAKVDGLARVLASLAEERQVVVFTHDSRLPDAVSRLEIDADVLEVVRAERSVVTIRRASDPIARYLDDAYAVAKSDRMPAHVQAPVVAELCRSALEAAFARIVWRTRLAKGVRHADIETALAAAKRTTVLAALAFFDDAARGGDVMGRINRYGPRFGDAFRACIQGVHTASIADPAGIVGDVRDFVKALG
jgi:hypothetical protein